MTKRILIYGDSNTWGDKGLGEGRYEENEQWPSILQKKLGEEFVIIQEGLCGRIAGNHDVQNLHRNGRTGYEIALRTASPVTLVIIALGTNDAKSKYNLSIENIIDDLIWFDDMTEEYVRTYPSEMENYESLIYLGVANFRNSLKFNPPLDFADRLNSSLKSRGKKVIIPKDLQHAEDGLHYSLSDHKKVAHIVYEKIKELRL